MATVTRTVTIGSTDTVTNTLLHSLIDTATVSGIVRADMHSTAAIVTISTTAPSTPKAGELWFDTNPASNQGMLRVYDGAQWIVVGEGFVGHYGQASGTVAAGALVKYDSSISDPSDRRLAVTETSAKTDRAVGVALTEMTTSVTTGIVVTRAKVLALKKLTGFAVVAGDPVIPSGTAGLATTGASTDHGQCFGEAVGIWLESAASGATTARALIFGYGAATWIAGEDPVDSLTAGITVVAANLNTWSGSWGVPTFIDLNAAPLHTVARILNVKLMNSNTAGTDKSASVHFRVEGSTEGGSTPLGASGIAGMFEADGGSENDDQCLFGQIILFGRPGASNDRIEIYVDSQDTTNNHRVRVWEAGIFAGGGVS